MLSHPTRALEHALLVAHTWRSLSVGVPNSRLQAAAAAKPSWRRRHRLAAVLRKFRQHDRVFVVTSNPAIGEIAGLLNLLMDTEASVGLGFVAGDSVVLVRSGPKCDAVRAILASRAWRPAHYS